MGLRILSTNTFTYMFPYKRVDITVLYNTIARNLQESGVRTNIGLSGAAGEWQGITGENRVIYISERGLFTMFITVCYTQKHVQIQICYAPQLKSKVYSDSAHTMRYSQWDMCINSTFDAIKSAVNEIMGKPVSESEEVIDF